MKMTRPRRVAIVEYKAPVSVKTISAESMSEIENSIRKRLAANEARRVAGLEMAGKYTAR